ncbi:tumor protein p53 inducible nuclear protein isoform X2 [Megachile rotundata]|uniref:tumor protein p53 inducible nuclear protein isoform X2 n=1 Tax=Megachile rotundata TaxID=143995 RepID=UPI003FD4D9D7
MGSERERRVSLNRRFVKSSRTELSKGALKSKKKVRMLSSLANYLLGGNISGAQDSREGSNNETPESLPVMARLSQVEVEGDDWILIDRTVEGTTALEESWYVTPPACFTRAGPVNVETSPLEDLLIEHPSMSVYRATASPVAPDTPPPTPDAPEERDVEEDVAPAVVSGTPAAAASLERHSPRRSENEQATRRPAIHDGRPVNGRVHTEERIGQLRSAQKILEKRSTQALKRGRLERSNKLREVFSVKGKRPRRQDRLRIQNSGANNNRKC